MTSSRLSTHWLRTLVKGGLAVALAIVGLIAYGAPAFSHDNLISATGSCASPLGTGYKISWTIENDWPLSETGSVTSVTGGLSTLSTSNFSIAASPGTPYSQTTITQTLPASASGTLTFDTTATWSDNFTTTDSGTFDLSSLNCAAPIQTLAGHIYLCNNSNPTTTEETGGTLAASGPSTVGATPNPLAPTDVNSGGYTMTATNPPGYTLVTCGGSSSPNGPGTSATESVNVPSGGSGVGIFYVTPVVQSIAGHIYLCNSGSPTTTEETGGTLAASGPSTLAPTANPLAPTNVDAGGYTMTATNPPGYQLVTCGGSSSPNVSGTSATESVTVPSGGAGVGLFYVTPILQSIAGHIYLCNSGSPTTTEETGGTLAASGPSTLAPTANPLAPTDVASGGYTMTATNPPHYLLVACGGSSTPNGSGTSATESVTVPSGGAGVGLFYVTPIVDSISVVKTASPASVSAVGQSITYTFVATNTGNQTLSDVSITDTQTAPATQGNLSAIDCASLASPTGTCSGPSVATLAPGQSATFNATYIVTQADLDNGSINDSATASGTPPGSTTPITSPPSTATVPVTKAPGISVVKTASPASVSAVGNTITYTFVATNTGNQTLSDVSITDTQTAPATQGNLSAIDCASLASPTGTCSGPSVATLVPGQSATFNATYIVTQADLDNGSINDSATASGTPPGSTTPITSPPSTATVPVTKAPGISVVKTASPASVSAVGQSITYTFVATNTGNQTLSDVSITDTQTAPATQGNLSAIDCASLASPTGTCSGPSVATLVPGQSATFNATYIVTQADLDNGSINDSATASGTPPGSTTPITSPPSTATVPVTVAPAITVVKSASPASVSAVGQSITYTFVATNTGNQTLSDVSITDTQTAPATQGNLSAIDCASLASPTGTCSGPSVATLVPGQSATFNATYIVTQADLNNGSINDSATASGTPPGSTTPITSPPSTATVPVTVAPAITVVKTASPASVSAVGQSITYTFVATNTGNQTLSDVSITDTQTAPATQGNLSAITCTSLASPTGTCSGPSVATLVPGQSATFNATYIVTQADLDNGSINDSATASGTPPGSTTPITSPPSTATVPVTVAPAITVVKTASPASVSAVGQSITYTFVATNTGNQTLSDVSITDTQTAPATQGNLSAIDCASLASPTGTCSGPSVATLVPGQSATFNATYIVTQADLDNGSINDSATASGTPPGSTTPITSPPSTATVPVTVAPAITVVKSASPASVSAVGQSITYTFVATNTGNQTLSDVSITDTQTAPATQGNLSAIDCASLASPTGTCSGPSVATLVPGQSATFNATYIVTQADLNNGSINDSATASGTPPGSTTPITSPPSTATVPVTVAPAITVVKTASPASVSAVGQSITYTFVATNTGNQTLSDVSITDTQTAPATQGNLSAIDCASLASPTGTCSGPSVATLAPGQSATFNATYIVTQADLNNGSINDSATASGTPPGSTTPITSPPSTATVPVTQMPTITLVKSAVQTNYSTPGQTINYNYLVTNTGNVTLSDITINDPHIGLTGLTCPDPTLAPGASETCTATYLTTQADVLAGSILNVATATGTPPTGDPVTSNPSTVTIPAASISILKQVCGSDTASLCGPGGSGPWESTASIPYGNTAYWKVTVTNTGQIALTGVAISDPLAPGCSSPAVGISLAVGASASVYCSTPDVTQDITNVATVTFTGQKGPPPTATATATPIPTIATKPSSGGVTTSPAVSVEAPPVTG